MTQIKQLLKKTYYVPKPLETNDNGMIKWGQNNLYPQWLNWMYYTSAVHQGLINGKVFFTTSGGLEFEGDPNFTRLAEQYDRMIPELSRSLELANCYYIKGLLSMDKKTIKKIKFLPHEWVRMHEDDGTYLVSEDWADRQVEFSVLRDLDTVRKSTDRTELWFIYAFKREGLQFQIDGKRKKLSENYYPVVPYSGAINSILTDIEIGNYQLSEVVNNFSLGTILNLANGKPKDEKDVKEIIDRISNETTGSDNAGGTLVTFSNGKETEPTVLHLNGNQLNERYLSLSKDVRDNIMKGHSVVSGELFGFVTDGNFNSSVIDWAYGIMKANYFRQRQTEILEGLEFLAEKSEFQGDANFLEVKIPTMDGSGGSPSPSAESFKKEKTEKEATQEVLERFKSIGVDKDTRKIVMSEELNLESAFGGIFEDKKNNFASAIDIQVLNLLLDGESFDAIRKALGIKSADLAKIYHRLRRGGHVDDKGQITDKGRLESINSQVAKMEILYSYELRPDAPPLVPGGKSREFCETLIGLNRLYSRQEIDQLSNDLKTNVWMYRGGWYHNWQTNKNEPSCRHYWLQNVVYRQN